MTGRRHQTRRARDDRRRRARLILKVIDQHKLKLAPADASATPAEMSRNDGDDDGR